MTVSHPLRESLDRFTQALQDHLRQGIAGEVEPLHQARVATRRLRELLPLCNAEVPRGPVRRAGRRLRRVGRALGGVREVDVSLALVGQLLANRVVDARSAARLGEHLRAKRGERRAHMRHQLAAVSVRKLERDLGEVARSLGMRAETDAWAQRLATRIAKRADRVKAAVGVAGALYIPDHMHAVRIAAKKLRYALELARTTGQAPTQDAVQGIKATQESLGQLHDFQIFGEAVRDLALPASPGRGIDTELERVRCSIEQECRSLHSEYVGSRERVLKLCASASTHAERIWTERRGAAAALRHGPPKDRVLKMDLGRSQSAARPRGA